MAASESRDAIRPGSGDRDTEFIWGRPRERLSLMQQARLLLMRGRVKDYRAGARGGAADGDLAYTERSDGGLWLAK